MVIGEWLMSRVPMHACELWIIRRGAEKIGNKHEITVTCQRGPELASIDQPQ